MKGSACASSVPAWRSVGTGRQAAPPETRIRAAVTSQIESSNQSPVGMLCEKK